MSSASGRPPAAIPPKRRDSSTAVWWILGIVAGGIVVMVVFGLALAGMLLHNLHVRNQGQNVEIQTPVGGIKVGHEATVNLPVYPGSTSASSHDNANVELSAGDGGFALAVENYQTTADLDKVSAWYAQKLGPSFRREKEGSPPRSRAWMQTAMRTSPSWTIAATGRASWRSRTRTTAWKSSWCASARKKRSKRAPRPRQPRFAISL